jgi:putative Mg2+ transporter-C (MgtC) family protein
VEGQVVFDFSALFRLETLGHADLVIRLGAAVLLGLVIGLDREWRNKPAGVRTHMLVSLAAAAFTILAAEMTAIALRINATGDPVRIVEAVTAGAAFLGSGSIIQSRGSISGLTTGANIWLAAAIGLACGAGLLALACASTLLSVIVISLLWLTRGGTQSEDGQRPGSEARQHAGNDEREG